MIYPVGRLAEYKSEHSLSVERYHNSAGCVQRIRLINDGVFFVLNATFSNISAISWRPVLVVEEAGVPPTIGKQLVNFITCGCKSSAPFLSFTKPGANPRRIGDRLV